MSLLTSLQQQRTELLLNITNAREDYMRLYNRRMVLFRKSMLMLNEYTELTDLDAELLDALSAVTNELIQNRYAMDVESEFERANVETLDQVEQLISQQFDM